ncbi:beta strand repeat-containing protein, partial [Psychrobacter sp. K31L]|uniref:beta strand repeat-containing protein n=1 Tax=Psychrobacter sp. K31L TaxID=2820758 RepID=UPI001B32F2EB
APVTLTNVADGALSTSSTDAVNGRQLNATNTNVTALQAGFNVSSNGADLGAITAGSTLDIGTAANSNLTVVKTGNTIDFALNPILAGLTSVQAGNSLLDNTGLTITGGPSVTTAGINAAGTKITNVADGIIAANSKDAINGSQLNTTNVAVADNASDIAINATGITGNANAIAQGFNIDADIGTPDNVQLGDTVTFTNSDNNLVATVSATGINYDLADNISVTQATIGDGTNSTVLTSTANGLNIGGDKLTNVADGTTSSDAVNFSQLQAVNTATEAKTDALGTSTATNLGGGATYNSADGTVSAPVYSVNNTNQTGVDAAITALDQGFTLQTDGTNAAAIKAGDTVDIGIAAGENNLTAVKTGNSIAYSLDKTLDLGTAGSLTTGNTLVNNDGISVAGGVNGRDVRLTNSGLSNGGNTITGVADGRLDLGSNQAVNGGQLFKVADSVTNNLGGGAFIRPNGTISAPTYTLDDGSNAGITANFNDVGSALDNLDGRTVSNTSDIANIQTQANQGFNISAAGGRVDNVRLGETVDFTNGDGNLVVTNDVENRINYNLAEDINLGADGSITTGNTVTDNAGVTVGDAAGNATTITTAGTSVTDGVNTSNYGAEGFTATDANGNSTVVNQTGVSFIDTNGATGPSITATGMDAGALTVSNLADGVVATDAATKGQVDAVADDLTDLTAGAVQYVRNPDNSVNYNQVRLTGTQAVIDQDDEGNNFVVSGGTTFSNVANGVNADDAVNRGQLDSFISKNITNVEVTDQDGNPVIINVTDQVVNSNIDDNNLESLFLTYDVKGQDVTDSLTLGETVQKLNTKGIKFAHTNAVAAEGDLGITNDSSAGGANSTAIGVNAIVEAGANNTIALGRDTRATTDATDSVVIGSDSRVSGQSAIAIGDGSQANGNQSIAIGTGNIVNGNNSGAIGDPTTINGNNSYSIGNNNNIASDDTFVLGNNVTSTVGGSVVLGTGSAAITGAGIAGYRSVGNAAIMATTSTTGAVAVGDAANGVYRQVTGVAAGTADSDAVNVSQLKVVSDALGDSNAALSNAAVQYDKNPDDTVNKGSITLGGAAGTTITNVNGGAINADSTDAINGGQLYNLGSDVASVIGGDAALDDAGNLTVTNIGGTGADNLNDAIAAVNTGNAQANEDIQANTDRLDTGLKFSADSGTNIDKSIGDSTALKFEGSNNIKTTATGSGIKFDLSGNISVDSVTADTITADTVTTGNTTVSTNGVTIANGPSMTTEGINAGDKTITGVADGIEVNDAVNIGQLNALGGTLSNSVNELGYKINEVEDGANAGVSAAMAMSSLPQSYIPGKSMVGGGIATYNGQSAVAIGVSKVSDNGRWVIKVNGTADSNGNAGGAVGAGFHF